MNNFAEFFAEYMSINPNAEGDRIIYQINNRTLTVNDFKELLTMYDCEHCKHVRKEQSDYPCNKCNSYDMFEVRIK